MKRPAVLTGVIIIVIALVVLVTPYVIGQQFEARFRSHVKRLARMTNVPMQVVAYHRGWFQSTAQTRVGSGDNAIRMRHVINHNPLTAWALARVESTPILNNATKIRQHFGKQSPLTVTTRFGFTGNVDIHAVSPALAQPLQPEKAVTMRWQGLTVDIHIDSSNSVTARGDIPKLAINKASIGQLVVKNIIFGGTGTLNKNQNSVTFWDTSAYLTIGQFLFQDQEELNLHIEFGLQSSINSGISKKNRYGMRAHVEVSNAVIQPLDSNAKPFNLSQAVVEAHIAGIPVDPLRQLLHQLTLLRRQLPERATQIPDAATQAARRAIMQALPKLLTQSTTLTVGIPAFDSNHGQLGLNGQMTFDAPIPGMAQLPPIFGLMRRANAELRFVIDQSLAAYAVQKPQLLRSLVMRDLLIPKDKSYTLEAHYGPQGFTINGQPALGMLLRSQIR